MGLKSTYDPTVDAWYFYAEGSEGDTIARTRELSGLFHVLLDVDENGNIIGLELI